jgi:hypothetical protein
MPPKFKFQNPNPKLLSAKFQILQGILPGIADKRFYQQKYQDSSTIDVTVKEEVSGSSLAKMRDNGWIQLGILNQEEDL